MDNNQYTRDKIVKLTNNLHREKGEVTEIDKWHKSMTKIFIMKEVSR